LVDDVMRSIVCTGLGEASGLEEFSQPTKLVIEQNINSLLVMCLDTLKISSASDTRSQPSLLASLKALPFGTSQLISQRDNKDSTCVHPAQKAPRSGKLAPHRVGRRFDN
jgi:hypothetical protein